MQRERTPVAPCSALPPPPQSLCCSLCLRRRWKCPLVMLIRGSPFICGCMLYLTAVATPALCIRTCDGRGGSVDQRHRRQVHLRPLLPFFFSSPSFPIPFSSSCAQFSRDCSFSSCLRFIAASPSGELQFVLSDLRALVNQDEFDLQAELPALVAE